MSIKDIVRNIQNKKLNDAKKDIFAELMDRSVRKIDQMKPEVMKNSFQEEVIVEMKFKKSDKISDKDVKKKLMKDDGTGFVIIQRNMNDKKQDDFEMYAVDSDNKVTKDWGTHPSFQGAQKFAKNRGYKE